MLDDLRNHDTQPNAQEQAWMSIDPFAVLLRIAVMGILAVCIGLAATQLAAPSGPDTVFSAER